MLCATAAGDSFALQLKTPSVAARLASAAKTAGMSPSRLGPAAQQTSMATAGTATQRETQSMVQREAEAVLRVWSEEDEGNGAAAILGSGNDMGSLTGWQALAQEARNTALTPCICCCAALVNPADDMVPGACGWVEAQRALRKSPKITRGVFPCRCWMSCKVTVRRVPRMVQLRT